LMRGLFRHGSFSSFLVDAVFPQQLSCQESRRQSGDALRR
jgi:hypothetical protein